LSSKHLHCSVTLLFQERDAYQSVITAYEKEFAAELEEVSNKAMNNTKNPLIEDEQAVKPQIGQSEMDKALPSKMNAHTVSCMNRSLNTVHLICLYHDSSSLG
jgi:phage protein D